MDGFGLTSSNVCWKSLEAFPHSPLVKGAAKSTWTPFPGQSLGLSSQQTLRLKLNHSYLQSTLTKPSVAAVRRLKGERHI